MKRKCSVCDCLECPNSIPCKRRQSQPASHFIFKCAKCGCAGVTDLRGKDVEVECKPENWQKPEEEQMSLPAPKESGKNSDRSPKLEPKHVKKGATITLTGDGREVNSDFGESLVLDITLGRVAFAWFVRMDSGNYRQLFKRFGNNLSKWKGKVQVTTDEYLGNKYIKVVSEK